MAGGEYVKNAKIGRAVMDADVFISLTHFKGHEEAGFGGCLKNIGMGCGSRAGKMEQHNAGKPHVADVYKRQLHASSTNMPPTKPIISTAYRTKNRMVEALERGLFFFAS